jgi:hypothetical protein
MTAVVGADVDAHELSDRAPPAPACSGPQTAATPTRRPNMGFVYCLTEKAVGWLFCVTRRRTCAPGQPSVAAARVRRSSGARKLHVVFRAP